MFTKTQSLCRSLLACCLVLLGSLANAQAIDYPTRTIKFVVPFPSGSATDQAAREAANYITRRTGQPVIVENKPGANGLIAAQQVARAAPDGYTVFITTMTTQSVNPFLYKKLPYDPVADFIPVAMISKSAMVLVVRNTEDQPKSVAELTARMQAAGSKLSFASGNTSSLVAGKTYSNAVSSPALHVPYKGNPQAVTDLMAGAVDFMFSDLTVANPLVQQGRLRGLGVTGPTRASTLPDVPTMREAGMPIELSVWNGAYVPAKTPHAVVVRLNELLNQATQSKQGQERFKQTGGTVDTMSPEEFAKFNEQEVLFWGRAVRGAGIQPE